MNDDSLSTEATGEEAHPVYPTAPVSRRIVAWIVDLVVTIGLAQAVTGILGLAVPLDSAAAFTLLLFVGLVVGFGYWGFATPLIGNTLGKWALGIQIRGVPGTTPRTRQWIGRMLMIALWPINALAMIASDDNRHLGDKVADTRVVMVTERNFFVGLVLAVVIVFISFNLGGIGLRVASLRMAPYQTATKELEARGLTPGVFPEGFRVINDTAAFDFDIGDGYRRVTLRRTDAGWKVDEIAPVEVPSTEAAISFGPVNATSGT